MGSQSVRCREHPLTGDVWAVRAGDGPTGEQFSYSHLYLGLNPKI